jgi:phage protein D
MAGRNGNGAADNGIKAARPTIAVGGQDKPSLGEGLLSLLIAENLGGLYRCELAFGNWGPINNSIGFLYFDRRLLEFGKALQVKLGTDTLFDGRIMGLEAVFPEGQPPALNVLAEDRFQDLRMIRRTRTFTDVSDADIFNQIAGDHGLRPSVSVSGPKYKVLAQVNQSDLAFLRERARAIDAELWMSGNTLNAKSHASRNGGSLPMTYGGPLREFTVLADLAGQRTSVTVNGWDVASKAGLQYEATESVLSGELSNTTSGASILSSALGQRKEALAHTVPLTSQEAQAAAEAYFRMAARRFVVGRGVAETNAKLRVGSYVDLDGLGPLFNGKYYVVEVRHIFDGARGLRTEFTAERPGLGRPQ